MPTPTGRSGKSLNFFLNLYDGMSKPVDKIGKSYDKMGKIFSGKYKKMKSSISAFNDATKKGIEGSRNLGSTTYNTITSIQSGYDSVIGKALDSIALIHDTLKEFLSLASEVNDMMISLNKNVDLVSRRSDEFHGQLLNMAIDYRVTFDELREILEATAITQFRNTKQLEKFVEAVNMLSVATGISREEAAETFEIYTKFYKGGYDGFLRLANVIRFTTANTKLAQREALGLMDSFIEVVKNLPQKYRDQAAKEVLAIGGAAKEAEVNLGDLQRAFSQITDKWHEQGLRLRAFISQNTEASISEVNKLVERGNFTKLFELMAKASKNLSEEQFLLMRQDFEALTGMSFDMARQLREFDSTQLEKIMTSIKGSSDGTAELNDAFEKAKSSFHALWKDLKSSLTPFLAGVLRPVLLELVKVMQELRPQIQDFGKWLIRQIPVVSNIILSAFKAMIWVGKKVYDFWTSLPPEMQEFIKYGALVAGTIMFMGGVVLPVIALMTKGFIGLAVAMGPLLLLGAAIYGAFKLLRSGIAKVLGVAPESLSFFETMRISWEALKWAGGKVVDVFKAMWGWVVKLGKAIKNSFAGKAFTKFFEITRYLLTGALPKNVQGQKFGDGGIVTRPTNALIGERGTPEAVIPLDKPNLSNIFGRAFDERIEDLSRDNPYSNLGRIPRVPATAQVSQEAPRVSVNVHQEQTNKLLKQILEALQRNRMMNSDEDTPMENTGALGSQLNDWGF